LHQHHVEAVAADRRTRARAAADVDRLATARSRRDVTVRPIEITDVDRLERMFGRFSATSIRFRFFSPLRVVPRSALLRLALVDHCNNEALVAVDGDEIVGVAGYNGLPGADHPGPRDAELAVAVEDAWHHRGLGRALAHRLASVARDRGCDAFRVRILPENRAALRLVRNLAPDAQVQFADGEYGARLALVRVEPVRDPSRNHADPVPTR
jgi:GNAT superfamily N-acetyltransferase